MKRSAAQISTDFPRTEAGEQCEILSTGYDLIIVDERAVAIFLLVGLHCLATF